MALMSLTTLITLLRSWSYWRRIEEAPERIDELEKRVVALENRLAAIETTPSVVNKADE